MFRSRALARLSLALAVLPAACGDVRTAWSVRFADPVLALSAKQVEATIVEGGCDPSARVVYRAHKGEASMPSPALAPGRYGFRARASDAECRWFAAGCVERDLPTDDDVVVTLVSQPSAPACAPAECLTDQGACMERPAAVWLSTSGNDETCARGDPTLACATFDRAYAIAMPGDTVEVEEGDYLNQVLQNDGRTVPAASVVFRPAPDARVALTSIEIFASAVEVRDMIIDTYVLRGPADGVIVRNVDASSMGISGGRNLSVLGGDVGPSENAHPIIGKSTEEDPAQDVRIEGVAFHDHSQTGDIAVVCLQIGGVTRLTIARSTFRNCASSGAILIGRFYEAYPSSDVVIENNFFYPNTGASSGEPIGELQYERSEPGLVISWNSFAGSGGLSLVAVTDRRPPATPSAVIRGNAAAAPPQSQEDGYPDCDSAADYGWNIWDGASCSTTDHDAPPGFVSLDDLHLSAGSPAIGGAAGAPGFPENDIDGQTRNPAGPLESGADEYM